METKFYNGMNKLILEKLTEESKEKSMYNLKTAKFGDDYIERIMELGTYTEDELKMLQQNIMYVFNNFNDYIFCRGGAYKSNLMVVLSKINRELGKWERYCFDNVGDANKVFGIDVVKDGFEVLPMRKDGIYLLWRQLNEHDEIEDSIFYIPSDISLSELSD